jgi:hypothetical protein
VALPDPVPGLVIAYEFLWQREHERKRTEGAKARPCVIVVRIERENDRLKVAVSPITHAPPDAQTPAIEIPARVKKHLGLDSERSWIVLNELNEFTWPGLDLRPVSRSTGRFDYGHLPPNLFLRVVNAIRDAWRRGDGKTVRR